VRLLLDSHILLRLDTDPNLVPLAHRAILEDPENEVFVSAATAWELGIKQSKGKLVLARPVSDQRLRWGFLELPISFAHAEFAASLPLLHGDPFDRMLVAQALVEGLTLVTADSRLADYQVPIL
jgi:PIN domain nuclease of toxin-antitoxin system